MITLSGSGGNSSVENGNGGAGLTEDQTATLDKLDGIVSSASEIDGSVKYTKEKTEQPYSDNPLVYSDNLYNKKTLVTNVSISGSSGEAVYNSTYHSTDFIEVKPSDKISSYGLITLAQYDKNKTFIKRDYIDASGEAGFQLRDDTWYVRYSGQYNAIVFQTARINIGETINELEDYSVSFKDVQPMKALTNTLSNYQDNIILDMDVPSSIYRNVSTIPDYTSFGDSLYTEVHTMFDGLISSDYGVKTQLLPTSQGYAVPLYTFSPSMPTSSDNTKNIKVLLLCGLHGNEKASTLSAYTMMKEIIDNSDNSEHLELLRHNVEFLIVPVVNPSGWDDFTRKSRNGVDINRNFPYDWVRLLDTDSPIYSGISPNSEIETQNIVTLLADNDDINMFVDFHNFHSDSQTGDNVNAFAYMPNNSNNFVQHLAKNLYAKMTREWKPDYSFIPDDYFIGYTIREDEGRSSNYAQSVGIDYSTTFEICWEWVLNPSSVPYDDDTIRCGSELLTNWILFNIKHMVNNQTTKQ